MKYVSDNRHNFFRHATKKAAAILACAAMILFVGCGGNSGSPDISDGSETSFDSGYKYEQELNIIDDNYRNYYEIFVRSFYDSDGDGIGDLNGVTDKLDYISDMGFNGIWLMPINPSATYHKYDVIDYYSVDKEYGSIDDFKKLASECEKRGIKLIIDLVFNHTSAKHEWFLQAAEYLRGLGDGEINLDDCKYAGYYNFQKGSKPGNGWNIIAGTDWYYECQFWDQMPDLNLDSSLVREEIENAAAYWLDLGAKGFRLDAAKEYFSGSSEKNTEVLQWFCEYVKSVDKDAYVVAEVWDSINTIADYYKSGIDSLFDFPLAQNSGYLVRLARGMISGVTPPDVMEMINDAYGENNPDFIDAPFISNHDTGRIANACVNDETMMKLSAGLLLTMNGSPFVYYGEEIGLNSYSDKDENKRLPMHWSDESTDGTTTKPSDADDVTQKHSPVDKQLSDPLSILNYYKRALRIRNENPEIARGVTETLTTSNENVSAVRKTWNDSSVEIYYNLTDTEQSVSVTSSIRGYLSTDGSAPQIADGNLVMPACSIAVLS